MSEAEKRLNRCSFTSHRPEKLHSSENQVKIALEKEIWRACQEGFRTFLTGMARGTDIWSGELILRLRSSHQADYEVIICETVCRSAHQRRNEWMVDHAARVTAVYNSTKGGTRNTIEYAGIKGVNVCYAKGWEVRTKNGRRKVENSSRVRLHAWNMRLSAYDLAKDIQNALTGFSGYQGIKENHQPMQQKLVVFLAPFTGFDTIWRKSND